MTRHVTAVILLLLLLGRAAALGDDWPQFRGPNRDGVSAETGLLRKWPKDGPRLLWVAHGLGGGFASIAIADGYMYTTGMVGNEKQGAISVYDVNGTFKWKATYGPEWGGSHPGSRTTPTIDGDRAYVLSGHGNLVCFDAKTGLQRWQADVEQRFAGQSTNWGISESALVVGDKVICTPGGADATVAALDKMTGRTLWTTKGLSDNSAHCSPILIEKAGKKLIVTITAAHVVGIDPQDGKVLWQHQNKLHKDKPRHVNPNSPLYHDGGIYVTSRFIGGTRLTLSPDGRNVSEAWTNTALDPHHGGTILVDGHIYGHSTKNSCWMCLDWTSGKTLYEKKWLGKGSIISADGMLYCYEEDEGTVGLIPASSHGFNMVSSFKVPHGTGKHWAHPAISDGTLYIRHGDALMAYDIEQK